MKTLVISHGMHTLLNFNFFVLNRDIMALGSRGKN